MKSKFKQLKDELEDLIEKGNLLWYSVLDRAGELSDEYKLNLKKRNQKIPLFLDEYESWYSEALQVIKQIIPDRYDDFVKQYKNDKRNKIDGLTYSISDYLLGIEIQEYGKVIAGVRNIISKMLNQVSILSSAQKRFESSLFDIKEVLQADIYDSELDAAKDLAKKGFLRGSGAIAGVVLEKHLGHVCEEHGLKSRKRKPTMADFYQLLKDNEIIDTPTWRFIQHLGDLRNLCDHNKDREPTKDEVLELVAGVDKVIKTVF